MNQSISLSLDSTSAANTEQSELSAGELLSPASLDGMDEVAIAEEAGASSSAAGADSDDSLPQPPTIPLVESIDEGLVPDIIAGTAGTPSVFHSAGG